MKITQFRKIRGIILITCLIFLTIVIMVVGLVAFSAKNGYFLANSYSNSEQAYYAALSGIEYARSRLATAQSANSEKTAGSKWMNTVSGNITLSKDSSDSLAIVEKDSKVVGYIDPESIGAVNDNALQNDAQIRSKARFEMQFVSPEVSVRKLAVNEVGDRKLAVNNESLSNASLEYLSCNNIDGSSDTYSLCRRNMDGKKADYVKYRSIPMRSCHLIVKGISGHSVTYVETFLAIDGKTATGASPIVAGDNIKTKLSGANSNLFVSVKDDKGNTSIKTMGNFLLSSGSKNGNILVFDGNEGNISAAGFFLNSNLKSKEDVLSRYGIELKDIGAASKMLSSLPEISYPKNPDMDNTIGVTAGKGICLIYDEVSKGWYSAEIDNYASSDKLTPVISSIAHMDATSFTTEGSKLILKNKTQVNGDMYVCAVADISKFKDLSDPSKGVTLSSEKLSTLVRPQLEFTKGSALYVNSTTKENKGLTVQGIVTGTGNIWSKSNISMQGGSYLVAEKSDSASFYAENDFNLLPTTGVQFSPQLIKELQDVWSELYTGNSSSIPADSYGNVVGELVRKLQDNATVKSQIQESEMERFAQSMISANSAWFVPNEQTPNNVKSDIYKKDKNENNLDVIHFAATGMDSTKYNGTLAKCHDPYRTHPCSLKFLSSSDSLSPYVRSFLPLANIGKKLNSGTSVSMRYGAAGFDYLDDQNKTLASEGKQHLEIWVHDSSEYNFAPSEYNLDPAKLDPNGKLSSLDNQKYPSDLFVYVTLDNEKNIDKIYTRFGYRKGNEAIPHKPYDMDANFCPGLVFNKSRLFYEAEAALNITDLTEQDDVFYAHLNGREVPIAIKNGDNISLNLRDIITSLREKMTSNENLLTHDNYQINGNSERYVQAQENTALRNTAQAADMHKNRKKNSYNDLYGSEIDKYLEDYLTLEYQMNNFGKPPSPEVLNELKKNLKNDLNYDLTNYIHDTSSYNARSEYKLWNREQGKWDKPSDDQKISLQDGARSMLDKFKERLEASSVIRNSSSSGMDFTLDITKLHTDNSGNDDFRLPFNTKNKMRGISTVQHYDNSLAPDSGKEERYFKLNSNPSLTYSLPSASDTLIKGIIFCKNGSFNGNTGNGVLTIAGGIITLKGGINLDAVSANLVYDPDYLGLIYGMGNPVNTKTKYTHIISTHTENM